MDTKKQLVIEGGQILEVTEVTRAVGSLSEYLSRASAGMCITVPFVGAFMHRGTKIPVSATFGQHQTFLCAPIDGLYQTTTFKCETGGLPPYMYPTFQQGAMPEGDEIRAEVLFGHPDLEHFLILKLTSEMGLQDSYVFSRPKEEKNWVSGSAFLPNLYNDGRVCMGGGMGSYESKYQRQVSSHSSNFSLAKIFQDIHEGLTASTPNTDLTCGITWHFGLDGVTGLEKSDIVRTYREYRHIESSHSLFHLLPS